MPSEARRRAPGREGRTEPDEIDWTIFTLLANGMSLMKISSQVGQCYAAVTKRIDWVRARRWATFEGKRILTSSERCRLLESEHKAMVK